MVDIFDMDCNITPVKAIKQHWTKQKFSYMETPRPDYGIMLLLNGRIDFISKSEIVCAKPGNVIFLPKNCYYEAQFHIELGDTDNYLINFDADKGFCGHTKPEIIVKNASIACADLFRQFVDENYIKAVSFRSKGLLYLLLDSVLSEKENKNTELNKVLEKAADLLQKDENISISAIARNCSVSESGLRKIFKDNLGMSPTQYRLNIKLNKAKYLLESTDMTVGEISEKLGFFDCAYFTKVFSKQTGMTPKKYSQSKKL